MEHSKHQMLQLGNCTVFENKKGIKFEFDGSNAIIKVVQVLIVKLPFLY